MISTIDPTKPVDAAPAVKADLRANLQSAKDEMEALQVRKTGLGHQHVLVDYGAVASAKIAANEVGASHLQDTNSIGMQDQQLTRPQLEDFLDNSTTPVISSGSMTLDLEAGNVSEVAFTEHAASLILADLPAADRAGSCSVIVGQDGTGVRSLASGGARNGPGGAPPAIASAANAVDVYPLVTRDGGVTWYGFLGGQDFS